MRDTFDGRDPEVIELIDPDGGLFGEAPLQVEGEEHSAGDQRVRSVAAALAVIAVIVGSLLAWKPWVGRDHPLAFKDPRATEAALSEQLVLDPPPAAAHGVTLGKGDATMPAAAPWKVPIGYLFGDADATISVNDGTDRWAGFLAAPATDPDAPSVDNLREGDRTDIDVNGAPGQMQARPGNTQQIVWGPLAGTMYSATTSGLTIPEALDFVSSVSASEGRVVVTHRSALAGMEPIGSFYDYYTVLTLLQHAQDIGPADDGVVGVYYGFRTQTVASIAANESALGVVPFVLSNSRHQDGDTELTVHGRPAVGFTKGAGPFGAFDITAVVWWEGGRLVMVGSNAELEPTVSLAETARPASPAEWSAILELA